MESLSLIKQKLSDPNKIFVILITIILFGFAIWYIISYINPYLYSKFKTNSEYSLNSSSTTNNPPQIELLLFYTTWCPICKKTKPAWDQFKTHWDGKFIHGYKLVFNEIDCDLNESAADKYKIDGYPTVKMLKDNKIITYDAKIEFSTLNMFLNNEFQ